ncbi:DNRLRE domain-containing protein [Acidobacteriota bacterium]
MFKKRTIVNLFIFTCILSLLLFVVPLFSTDEPVIVEVRCSKDSLLRSGSPDTNEGANLILLVQGTGPRRAIVGFDISTLQTAGLKKATLKLNISEPTANFSSEQPVFVHRLIVPWTEGNGFNLEASSEQQYRGDGSGVTWNCATDTDIDDQGSDCDVDWRGGWSDVLPSTAPALTFINGMEGEVSWDVTLDVKGAFADGFSELSFLVKKESDSANGRAAFYSKEDDLQKSALLVLEYGEEDPPPASSIVEIDCAKDTFLRSGSKNTNEGANYVLRLQASGQNRSLVGFDLSSVQTEGLLKAELALTISEEVNNCGTDGRLVYVHRVAVPWEEGNGYNARETGGGVTYRGDGAGATWNCGIDADIKNTQPNCDSQWDGAWIGILPATAAPLLVTNNMVGRVSWDVTTDITAVLNGGQTGVSWLVKKEVDSETGKVVFHSREGHFYFQPQLVLEYQSQPDPEIIALTPSENIVTQEAALTISGEVENTARVEINGTEVSLSNNQFSHVVTLQPGDNPITVTAFNEIGGTDSRSFTVTYNPDTLAPAIEITSPPTGSIL